MEICQKTFKPHDLEYHSISNGEEWGICTKCQNIVFVRYHDVGSGG